jgi:hypothetical protein
VSAENHCSIVARAGATGRLPRQLRRDPKRQVEPGYVPPISLSGVRGTGSELSGRSGRSRTRILALRAPNATVSLARVVPR